MSFQKATLFLHLQLLCFVPAKEEEEKRVPRGEVDGCCFSPVKFSVIAQSIPSSEGRMFSWGSDPERRSRGAPGPAHPVPFSLCHCV